MLYPLRRPSINAFLRITGAGQQCRCARFYNEDFMVRIRSRSANSRDPQK